LVRAYQTFGKETAHTDVLGWVCLHCSIKPKDPMKSCFDQGIGSVPILVRSLIGLNWIHDTAIIQPPMELRFQETAIKTVLPNAGLVRLSTIQLEPHLIVDLQITIDSFQLQQRRTFVMIKSY
jgi:hypothetical protein